jgi:hypothetical protein
VSEPHVEYTVLFSQQLIYQRKDKTRTWSVAEIDDIGRHLAIGLLLLFDREILSHYAADVSRQDLLAACCLVRLQNALNRRGRGEVVSLFWILLFLPAVASVADLFSRQILWRPEKRRRYLFT